MKIVFMGTPDFSVPALEELAKVHQVAAVVTQQDRQRAEVTRCSIHLLRRKH